MISRLYPINYVIGIIFSVFLDESIGYIISRQARDGCVSTMTDYAKLGLGRKTDALGAKTGASEKRQ